MLSIKNNMMASNAARHLSTSYGSLAKSVERLSSGLRINGAKDDAAGLAVRELIRADAAALRQGSRNASDAISMLQSAEGGLAVIDDILVRMRELAEQAATGSYSSDQKDLMQAEFAELANEISRIADNTDFNDNYLLKTDQGDAITIALGIGTATAAKVIKVDTHNVTADGLGIGGTVESYSANHWVTADTANYIGGEAAGGGGTLKFEFGAQGAIEIAIAQDTDNTLAGVVTLINNASRLTTENYDAAEAYLDSTTGQYTLKVSAAAAGVIDTTVTASGAGTIVWGAKASGVDVAAGDFVENAGTGTVLNIKTAADTAIAAIDLAITEKDNYRAHLGYMMNRLESAISVIDIQSENLDNAESRISDVDVATEMAAMTRNQVLAQAGISMLAQANSMPQMALKLIG